MVEVVESGTWVGVGRLLDLCEEGTGRDSAVAEADAETGMLTLFEALPRGMRDSASSVTSPGTGVVTVMLGPSVRGPSAVGAMDETESTSA
jgi:hypothetical protein